MPVSRECAAWGMRMLLGQEPRDEADIDAHRAGHATLASLRTALLRTPDARRLFVDANAAPGPGSGPGPGRFAIPPFLLRRPNRAGLPWRFEPPSLEQPVSQLCTSEQMEGPLYDSLCVRLAQDPADAHRRFWEYAFVLAVLQERGLSAPGRKGLGFAPGPAPLPSALAASGVSVVATHASSGPGDDRSAGEQPDGPGGTQQASWQPDLVDRETFLARVAVRPADPHALPPDLRGFDFCWSCGLLEHLGPIDRGLGFLRRSLDSLKPGGVAVHTTTLNLGSDTDTFERPELVLFRRRDIERGLQECADEGHTVAPLNLWPGAAPADEHVDLPPYGLPHLKLEFQRYPITSIGLVVTKAARPRRTRAARPGNTGPRTRPGSP